MKNLLIVCLFLVTNVAFGQKKRIYFMADTAELNRDKASLEIGKEATIKYFAFLCRCLPPDYSNPSFVYKIDDEHDKIFKIKPGFKYTSLERLVKIIKETGRSFGSKYDLYITEVLSKNQYMIHKVSLVLPKEPIIDIETIKP